MDAFTKVRWANKGVLRATASAALLSVMLGACSSVPDAINPVSWYEKTTDFFSGDSQAADTSAPNSTVQNKGLSADPDAPPPAAAPSQQVSSVPSGLSADQVDGNYASPPIDRQGAPSNVLAAPSTQVAQTPPAPASVPRVAVTPAPAASQPMPKPMATPKPMTATAPSAASSMPPSMPKSMPMASKMTPAEQYASAAPRSPQTFEFPSAAAQPAFGNDSFETVVITADGMEAMPEPAAQPSLSMSASPSANQQPPGALFPEPGSTTSGEVGPAMVGGMLRVATIHFANNSSNLDHRDRSILGAVIQLQKERGGRVVVVGHASARTKDMDYIKHQMVNFEISMQRAGSIGSVMKGMGLPGEVLEVQAVSDAQPLFMEVMPSGEAGNRRVEIYLAGAAT